MRSVSQLLPPVNDKRSANADSKAYEQPWTWKSHVRLPNDNFINATTFDGVQESNAMFRVKHKLCVEVRHRVGSEKAERFLVVRMPISITHVSIHLCSSWRRKQGGPAQERRVENSASHYQTVSCYLATHSKLPTLKFIALDPINHIGSGVCASTRRKSCWRDKVPHSRLLPRLP